MKRLCISVVCIMLTSASVFAETTPKSEKEQENAVVHIYRPAKIVGFGWVFKLKIKGNKPTKVKNGKYLTLQLAPGQTEFRMKKNLIQMNLEPGKHYYLRASLVRNMFLGKPQIVEVTERQARNEMKGS